MGSWDEKLTNVERGKETRRKIITYIAEIVSQTIKIPIATFDFIAQQEAGGI